MLGFQQPAGSQKFWQPWGRIRWYHCCCFGGLGAWRASSHWPRSLEDWLGGIYASMGTREEPGQRGRIQHPFAESMGHAHQPIGGTQRRLTGLWRNGSASDSRSEGWEFESLWPHLPHAGVHRGPPCNKRQHVTETKRRHKQTE